MKTKREALRVLKRQISNAVYRQLVIDAGRRKQRPGRTLGSDSSASAAGSRSCTGSSAKSLPDRHQRYDPYRRAQTRAPRSPDQGALLTERGFDMGFAITT